MTRTQHLDDEALISIAQDNGADAGASSTSIRARSVRTNSSAGAGSPIGQSDRRLGTSSNRGLSAASIRRT